MIRPSRRHSTVRLPTYTLYGETGKSLGIDWLHCESIAERSRLHGWEIKPHRHASLFQILYVRQGRVRVDAEGTVVALRGACVVTMPALMAHGFAFSPDVDGVVITVVEQHLRQLLVREPALRDQVLRLRCEPLPQALRRPMREMVGALQREHAAGADWRMLAIDAALLRLVVALGRGLGTALAAHEQVAGRAVTHVQRFRALVEQRYREQAGLTDYAGKLGITPTQLNRVCGRVLGRTALSVIHERTVLEAQRELAYTTLSVKQIALDLGFSDAGYFTRFFQRETGRTPTAWREAAAGAEASD